MEGNQPKIGKYALKFGVISGLIGIVFSLMLYFQKMHYEQTTATMLIGTAILFGVIAVGVNQYKKDNEGFLKLGQALKLGTGIALIGGIIGLIYYFLLTNNIIEAGYMEKAMELAKNKAFEQNPNMTQEQWDQGMAMQSKLQWLAYPFGLIINAILGLVGGLITGLIMKKDRSQY